MGRREVPAVRVELTADEIDAVTGVLTGGQLVGGPQVAAFEREFSETLLDGRPCVAVNSGTSALHLGLLACGIGPGDEVVVPSFTFAATANAVAITGATPVFADIDPASFCLDPRDVAARITPRTRAVLPVHLYGHPADWQGLAELAGTHGLMLLEDAAQAHGASYGDRPVGTLGTWAAFSFYATKNMTTGEGGLVACADEETARRVRLLRNQGMERRYANEVVGLNNRLTDVAAGLGRVQLTTLAQRNALRRAIADRYTAGLRGAITPTVRPGDTHAFHQYTVRVPQRDGVLAAVRAAGVDAAVYYPTPVHRLPGLRHDGRAAPHRGSCRGVHVAPDPSAPVGRRCRLRRGDREPRGRELWRSTLSQLRAGLIGLGEMGRHHARVLQALDGVQLVGVCDPLAPEDSPGCPVDRTPEALLARGIDVCVVASPTTAHLEHGLMLAEAGVHTLVEKPISLDHASATRLAEAFGAAGLVGAVGHIERYNPALQALRTRLASGELGEIYQVATRRQGPFPTRVLDVGVVLDLATHDIDSTAWVTKQRYTSVSARVAHRSGRRHEDLVGIVATLEDGTVVNHLVNWLSP